MLLSLIFIRKWGMGQKWHHAMIKELVHARGTEHELGERSSHVLLLHPAIPLRLRAQFSQSHGVADAHIEV